MKNELGRVRKLIEDYQASGETRARFARARRIHPSAFSRLLRVRDLPEPLLGELAQLPRLSRTHLEVIATAPAERRPAVLEAVKQGRSTYRIRERRETTAVSLATTGSLTASGPQTVPASTATASSDAAPSPETPAALPVAATTVAAAPAAPALPEPLAQVARALGATPDEALAFAAELVSVLWRSGPDRVEGSFEAFRAGRAARA